MAATPQRILVLHNNNDIYGADKILLELLSRVDRSRFDPIVVLPTDTRSINRFSPRLEKLGIECHFAPLGVLRRRYFRPMKLPAMAHEIGSATRTLIKLMRDKNIALVHTNTNTILAGALAARAAGLPHIWSVHELMVEPAMVRRTLHFLIPRLSDRVITVSMAVRDHMLKDARRFKRRFELIVGGIDLDPFLGARGRDQVRTEWGVGQEIVIGMASRVSRWKGQAIFAEAAKLVLQRHGNVKFVAVGGFFEGEGFLMDRFKQKVAELGIQEHFIINGFRGDMPDVFAAFDIFVLPSTLPEPFGLVVIEAMAASRPVVATAPGGPSETVVDRETGYLVAPSDAHQLAAALEDLIEDPPKRLRMGEAGRKRACQLFELPRYVKDFEDLYARVLVSHRNGMS